jgi:hypothetical protein
MDIPYHQLTSVELVRRTNHPVMILATLLLISSILAILAGAVVLAIGARGKLGYYQLHSKSMAPEVKRLWQVEYQHSGSFIATLRSAAGQLSDSYLGDGG